MGWGGCYLPGLLSSTLAFRSFSEPGPRAGLCSEAVHWAAPARSHAAFHRPLPGLHVLLPRAPAGLGAAAAATPTSGWLSPGVACGVFCPLQMSPRWPLSPSDRLVGRGRL